MKYDVIAINRFTGKIIESHTNVDIEVVYQVQDVYFLKFWIKVEVGDLGFISPEEDYENK